MLRYARGVLAASVAGTLSCLVGMLVFASLLLAVFLYAPVLAYGRRRRQWSRGTAALIAAFVLNLPVYAYLAIGVLKGGVFGGVSEAMLFALAFAVAALVFSAASATPRKRLGFG